MKISIQIQIDINIDEDIDMRVVTNIRRNSEEEQMDKKDTTFNKWIWETF